MSSASEQIQFLQASASTALGKAISFASSLKRGESVDFALLNGEKFTTREFKSVQGTPAPEVPKLDGDQYERLTDWLKAQVDTFVQSKADDRGALDATLEWVKRNLNSGDVLGASYDGAVMARARARAADAADQMVADDLSAMAARGFRMPGGAAAAIIERARRQTQQIIADANRALIEEQIRARVDMQKVAAEIGSRVKVQLLQVVYDMAKLFAEMPRVDADVKRVRADAMAAYYEAVHKHTDLQYMADKLNLEVDRVNAQFAASAISAWQSANNTDADADARMKIAAASAMGDAAAAALSAQTALVGLMAQASE